MYLFYGVNFFCLSFECKKTNKLNIFYVNDIIDILSHRLSMSKSDPGHGINVMTYFPHWCVIW